MRATRETPEYAAMMRRMLAAWARRVADGDPEDLAELLAGARLLDAGIRQAVTEQRATYGTSWAAIGDALGVTRQAAQQRYGLAGEQDHTPPPRPPSPVGPKLRHPGANTPGPIIRGETST